MPAKPVLAIRLFTSAALATVLALSVAGCKTTGEDLIPGSLTAPEAQRHGAA